jgi:predicted nucleic acid-binding protein
MSGRYLLDTNIVIALFEDDFAVVDRLTEIEEVFVPSVVVGGIMELITLVEYKLTWFALKSL